MQVVEDENERPVRGEALEQRRAPLDGSGSASCVTGALEPSTALLIRGKTCAEVRQHIGAQRLENRRCQPPHIFLERICDHPERHVAVEL